MTKTPILSIIVARTKNHCIGINGDLPFHLRSDLQNFKKLTSGKPIIMGRKTFQSLPKLLPNRTHIVISRDYNFKAASGVNSEVLVFSNLVTATAAARAIASENSLDEVFVIGGGEIYNQAQSLADKIYLTEADCEIGGDTFFEINDESAWETIETTHFTATEHDQFPFDIKIMVRKPINGGKTT